MNPLHADVVEVARSDGITFEYWHIITCVSNGQYVTAYRTVVGHINAPWAHVHFSGRHGGTYINPLRPGALSPYRDNTRPTVHVISFERSGAGVGSRLSGTVDLVAEAWDTTPVAVAPPWFGKPVTPALVQYKILARRELAKSKAWDVAVDFRGDLPRAQFLSIYARWTRQNHAATIGRYRFYLAQGFDTRALANGAYRLAVRVTDTAGNTATSVRPFTVSNLM